MPSVKILSKVFIASIHHEKPEYWGAEIKANLNDPAFHASSLHRLQQHSLASESTNSSATRALTHLENRVFLTSQA